MQLIGIDLPILASAVNLSALRRHPVSVDMFSCCTHLLDAAQYHCYQPSGATFSLFNSSGETCRRSIRFRRHRWNVRTRSIGKEMRTMIMMYSAMRRSMMFVFQF